ncbi:pentapeptide repeat-containing protein [Erwinia sp. BC051422]|uniref:pentapeptide repeat-containing protein n=1 Tax=Erwinia wuhanensis TaxID=3045167 RepID=UPI0026511079|nr:pentapeptide repeat-containing protein [Erwinia sp. BC051422]MDN8542586.1 pentapeptide repeat-containing protein [Erwinia sp. BC051422]
MTKITDHKEYFDTCFDRQALPSACFEGVIFEGCDFSHCNFTAARFIRCKFINCRFDQCNLSVMEMPDSRFNEVIFTECKLSGTDWTRAYWPAFNLDHELRFTQCLLSNASFFGLTLQEVKMMECQLHDVDFRECDLSKAEILNCDLAGSLFNRTNLQAADLTDSRDFSINVLNNSVAGATFSRLEALSLLESLGVNLVD